MSKKLDLDPGQHSFYGSLRFRVESGNPYVLGRQLYPGFESTQVVYIFNLPLTFISDKHFSLTLYEVPLLLQVKKKYFECASAILEPSFTQILEDVYYSSSFHSVNLRDALKSLLDSILHAGPCSILVSGTKGVGKSLAVTYLLNSILNENEDVILVDIDPGQGLACQFGLIGITYINKSYLVSEFFNDSHELEQKLYIYGSDTPSEDINLFLKIVDEMKKNIPQDKFVVINTFSLTENNILFSILQNTVEKLNPKHFIQIARNGETSLSLSKSCIKIYPDHIQLKKGLSPKERRELRLINYFEFDTTLVSVEPKVVDLTKTFIYTTVSVPEPEILNALNGSIVYLSRINKEVPDGNTAVMILKNAPISCSYGSAIVRAINKDARKLYLITPIDISNLNLIVYAKQTVPSCFYLNTNGSIPCYYTPSSLLKKNPGSSTLFSSYNGSDI